MVGPMVPLMAVRWVAERESKRALLMADVMAEMWADRTVEWKVAYLVAPSELR
jgi:hypothetical protein